MSTFDEPDGVQGWESDEKVFLDKVWAPECEKVAFLLNLGLALELGLGLAFQGVKMSTLYDPDGVQDWESDEKSVFGQRLDPKVWKKWTFLKLGLALGLRLGL